MLLLVLACWLQHGAAVADATAERAEHQPQTVADATAERAEHQSQTVADATAERAEHQSQKERRLNIAGWTLVGTGIAFPVTATAISASRNLGQSCDIAQCADVSIWVTSMVVGPVMIVTGTALLLKRRRLRQRQEPEASVIIVPGVTGISVSGRF